MFVQRKDEVFLRLQELLKPFGITKFYTDGWGAYERHLDAEQHYVEKLCDEANYVAKMTQMSDLL